MRYDAIFIGAGLIILLFGEVFGMWMGMTGNFQLGPSHAHLNLLGWVTLTLYGLAHRAFPALASAKLAPYQCGLAILGAIVLPAGIGIAIASTDSIPQIASIGSVVVFLATLLFAIMFFGKVAAAKA